MSEPDNIEQLKSRLFPIGTFEESSAAGVVGGHNQATNNGLSHTPNIKTITKHADYEMEFDMPGPHVAAVGDHYDPIFEVDIENRIVSILAKKVTIETPLYKTLITVSEQDIDQVNNTVNNYTDNITNGVYNVNNYTSNISAFIANISSVNYNVGGSYNLTASSVSVTGATTFADLVTFNSGTAGDRI